MTAILGVLAAGVCIILFFRSVQKARDESEAEFGNSWDLLSSKIKLRFPNRADYVQNRSHVFLQHMNVKSFQYDLQADT
ncbi:hypothetical protein [Peribacillus sp. Bi134]|uniref:hypothetical protein n=1 Tax=Peribacillus sp. Bi134 TaxID=2884272 RepID=UPI001D6DADB8|nr:hypothetical protein [Peribacillus sp. Bi134]CAH0233213.1 hypothetical protein SRABI134_02767 [Peribacillus sp. Bi134]